MFYAFLVFSVALVSWGFLSYKHPTHYLLSSLFAKNWEGAWFLSDFESEKQVDKKDYTPSYEEFKRAA